MHTLAERVETVEHLSGIPALSNCTTDVLKEYVAHTAITVHCDPGKVLCGLREDHNLYVIIAGKAELHVSPDVTISLEPGDYVGSDAALHKMSGTVVAVTDVEAIVIGPQDIAQLEYASCRDRHPSRIGWRLERSTPLQVLRRSHRQSVMARQAV